MPVEISEKFDILYNLRMHASPEGKPWQNRNSTFKKVVFRSNVTSSPQIFANHGCILDKQFFSTNRNNRICYCILKIIQPKTQSSRSIAKLAIEKKLYLIFQIAAINFSFNGSLFFKKLIIFFFDFLSQRRCCLEVTELFLMKRWRRNENTVSVWVRLSIIIFFYVVFYHSSLWSSHSRVTRAARWPTSCGATSTYYSVEEAWSPARV